MASNPPAPPKSALLYRYRSLAGEFGRSTAEDIIVHSRMFWSSPAEFNDPMDCRPNFIFGRSRRDQIAWMRDSTKRQFPDARRNQRRGMRKKLMAGDPRRYRQAAIDGFSLWMRESAVCCFSTVSDSLLMWSHYADQHRGVVFVFEELFEPQPFFAFPVVYSDKRPPVDITTFGNDGRNAIQDAVLTKASAWSYEAEKRMFEYRSAPGHRRFPSQALRGVIFGARISNDDRNFVSGLIAASRRQIHCSTARLSETDFVLEIVED